MTFGPTPTMAELADRLRTARAANPPSLLQRMEDDPEFARRMKAEARERAPLKFPHLFDPNYAHRLWRQIGGGDAVGLCRIHGALCRALGGEREPERISGRAWHHQRADRRLS